VATNFEIPISDIHLVTKSDRYIF